MKISELERALLAKFPAEDACDWDRTGLLAGDPQSEVARVVVALDPTIENVRYAAQAGANVLLTHHPAFLDAPSDFQPADSPAQVNGAVVYEALSRGVALMNFHTALDFNPAGYGHVPALLELNVVDVLQPIGGSTGENGYGAICAPIADNVSETASVSQGQLTLGELAARCNKVLGGCAQIWGDPECAVSRIAWGQGSASSLTDDCVSNSVDCLLCGEIKYHAALDLKAAGVSVIVLGHDVSEEPFVDVLARAAEDCGVSRDNIDIVRRKNWTTV